MRRTERFRTLTPLRAMELLEDTHATCNVEHRLENVRRALREHIKAALVKASRRKRR